MGNLSEIKNNFKQDEELRVYFINGSMNEILLDLDKDGIADIALIDDDKDGDLDTIAVDLTGDGEFNLYLMDLDENGTTDAVVYEESGEKDPKLLGLRAESEERIIALADKAYAHIIKEDWSAKEIASALMEIETEVHDARGKMRRK